MKQLPIFHFPFPIDRSSSAHGGTRLEMRRRGAPSSWALCAGMDLPVRRNADRSLFSIPPTTGILAVVAALFFSVPPAHAQSWADRAATMNRKEISAAQAAQRGGAKDKDRRNRVSMRRIRPAMKNVDWDADPTAIPSAMYQFNKRTDLPVYIDNDGIDLATDEIYEYTVLYMTAHTGWSLNEKESGNLALWLRRGGTLFLDDCYLRGSPFGECVKPEVARLMPGAEPTVMLKEDPRVADTFRILYPAAWPGEAADFENRPWQYYLLDGRPTVFFTPNDDGCGWEYSTPPTASNPLGEPIGHGGDNRQREAMFQWLADFLLFVYTH